jgi:hypothetical protein
MRWLVRTLAGIQTGVLTALMALAWVWITSGWRTLNLFGALFYSPWESAGYHTAAGAALILILFVAGAVLWSVCLRRDWRWTRGVLFALPFTAAYYLLQSHFLWKRFNPWLYHAAPPLSLWGAWLIFAVGLSFSPWLVRSMERDFLLN